LKKRVVPRLTMSTEKFCLRWNDFETNISSAFREIREDKDFFDVTLACDNEQIQAHKVILSACSPFFRTILRRNQHSNPLLYLKGVRFTDLTSVLNFMYHGEVNVAQEELNSFLAVAEELKVKGLTQGPTTGPPPPSPSPQSNHSRKSSSFVEPSSREPTAPPKRPRPSLPQQPPPSSRVEADVEVQEVEQPIVKSEPVAHHYQVPEQSVATYQGGEAGYGEEDYGAYEDESAYDGAVQLTDTTKDYQDLQDPEELYQFVGKSTEVPGTYSCSICKDFKASRRGLVRNHVESIHFRGVFRYHCDFCDKDFQGRNALAVHNSSLHPTRPKPFPAQVDVISSFPKIPNLF